MSRWLLDWWVGKCRTTDDWDEEEVGDDKAELVGDGDVSGMLSISRSCCAT